MQYSSYYFLLILVSKTNHKNIDFKYKTSITDTLDATMFKCNFCHGEMTVITHGISDHNVRCSLYDDI